LLCNISAFNIVALQEPLQDSHHLERFYGNQSTPLLSSCSTNNASLLQPGVEPPPARLDSLQQRQPQQQLQQRQRQGEKKSEEPFRTVAMPSSSLRSPIAGDLASPQHYSQQDVVQATQHHYVTSSQALATSSSQTHFAVKVTFGGNC
jgi:hypothetical protein